MADNGMEALTFDDVLLVPQASEVLPNQVSLKTRLTKNISLNIPIVSAAMDTVTESTTAIVMAKEGGIGIIHKNMSLERQAEEIRKVKSREHDVVINPRTVSPKTTLKELYKLVHKSGVSSFPVIDKGKVVGIVTKRDLLFVEDLDMKVETVMTKKIVSVPKMVSIDEAKKILRANRIEKLPIIDEKGRLKGLITTADIKSKEN